MNGSEVKVILCEELENLKKQIIEQHFAAGQKASGRTAASLHIEASESEATLYGRSFFDVLETGRKAGRTPKNFSGDNKAMDVGQRNCSYPDTIQNE